MKELNPMKPFSKKHGLTKSPLMTKWGNMKDRCYNPKSVGYKYYGGRGITVCDEWRNDFKAFHDWCIANGYRNGLQLDRIDNNKGYSPTNCRFVNNLENIRNRRNTIVIEYKGVKKFLQEWANELNVDYTLLQKRLWVGWTVEDAFTKPIRKTKRLKRCLKIFS